MAKQTVAATLPAPPNGSIFLWPLWTGTGLFLWTACLDWYLAPRFTWLALVLLCGAGWMWRHWRTKGDWQWSGFGCLLAAWYGLNLASVWWAFSFSEAIFFTQKVFLFVLTYWFFSQCLHDNAVRTRRTLFQATLLLSVVALLVVGWELGRCIAEQGLDNQYLYDHVRVLYGNKSLSTDFLFFLLILNAFFYRDQPYKTVFWAVYCFLLLLILLLQTRTVYVALVLSAGMVAALSVARRPGVFLQKKIWLLSFGLLAFGLLLGLYGLSRTGGSLAERLNPATYLDSGTASERRFVWYKTAQLNREYPWLGVGNGSWKFKMPSQSLRGGYRLEGLQVAFTRAHNDYLEIQSELGWIGLLLFVGIFGWALIGGARRLRSASDPEKQDLSVLMAGLAGYCVIQYFDFPRERMEIQVWLALVLALLRFYSRPAQPLFTLDLRARSIVAAFVLAGLLACLYIGWMRMQGEIHNIRMLEAIDRRDYRAAIREAQAAENPCYEYDDVTLPLAWYEGSAWYAMKQHEPAIRAFKRAFELNPWNYQTINNYGTALVSGARPGDTAPLRQAVELYKEASRINPRHPDSKFNIAYTLYELGDYQEALQWINQVDTLSKPKTPADFEQNRAIRARQEEYRKPILEKLGQSPI